MNLKELSDKLNMASQRHFQDMPEVEFALENYVACLKIVEGDRVIFDRSAKRYAKIQSMEKDVSSLLHEQVSNILDFEIYSTPKTSS